ncbi:transposase [Paenibacillus sp. 79R4]|uniref:DUF6262 family protein n=1 Tax=Paenibacillus sp. 79R4 TaxID=2212847 RepID=UPI0015BAC50E|nr:DUF6262 family protein [Paenibacillus sp. 79R4]NWL87479.1 transposase [Paenibacillus sp. 79R4]
MANHNPNYSGLLMHAKNKSEEVEKRVDDALKKMIKNQLKINFNSVSEQCGVSKAFLYKNEKLRNRIEVLRQQQIGLSSPKQVKRHMSDASKDVIIVSLRNRITKLETENKELKEQLKINFGKVYESI